MSVARPALAFALAFSLAACAGLDRRTASSVEAPVFSERSGWGFDASCDEASTVERMHVHKYVLEAAARAKAACEAQTGRVCGVREWGTVNGAEGQGCFGRASASPLL
jgi:hypothetical protein